jgi:hypothetical protein
MQATSTNLLPGKDGRGALRWLDKLYSRIAKSSNYISFRSTNHGAHTRHMYMTFISQAWWNNLLSWKMKHKLNHAVTAQAFNFAFKGYFKSFYGYDRGKDGKWKWLAGNVASGSAAGATTSLLLYHLDCAWTRLATDAIESKIEKRQFMGLLDVYKKTLTTIGVPGLYRGFSVSIVGITLYRGLYFGIYDTVKPLLLVELLEVMPSFWHLRLKKN